MRWLVRLVTPPHGTVLDPFMGSGSTGMACRYEQLKFIGIERQAEYVTIAECRIAAAAPLLAVASNEPVVDVRTHTQKSLFVADESAEAGLE